MPDDENKEYESARRKMEGAIDELRILRGKAPIYGASADKVDEVSREPPFCSFCGKGRNQVKHMLQGNDAYICDQCLTLGYEIVSGLGINSSLDPIISKSWGSKCELPY